MWPEGNHHTRSYCWCYSQTRQRSSSQVNEFRWRAIAHRLASKIYYGWGFLLLLPQAPPPPNQRQLNPSVMNFAGCPSPSWRQLNPSVMNFAGGLVATYNLPLLLHTNAPIDGSAIRTVPSTQCYAIFQQQDNIAIVVAIIATVYPVWWQVGWYGWGSLPLNY